MQIDEQVTFKKLEVFLGFMKLGSLTRVAEHVGQSTVSVHRAIHSLEEGLRCPLFRRDGRKLIPLAAAYAFAEHAAAAVRACSDGIRRAREESGFAGARLKIGALYSLTVGTIPRLLIRLKTRRPDLDVDLTLSSNRDLLDKLAEGQLDAILIAVHAGFANPDLVATPLFDDAIYFATALDSPFAGRSQIELGELRGEKFVALTEDFATYEDFSQSFARAGFEPDVVMRVGDIFSLTNLVGGGMGHSLLPGRVADFSPQVRLIPLHPRYAVSQRITLLVPRNRERQPNLLALSAECRMFSAPAQRPPAPGALPPAAG